MQSAELNAYSVIAQQRAAAEIVEPMLNDVISHIIEGTATLWTLWMDSALNFDAFNASYEVQQQIDAVAGNKVLPIFERIYWSQVIEADRMFRDVFCAVVESKRMEQDRGGDRWTWAMDILIHAFRQLEQIADNGCSIYTR